MPAPPDRRPLKGRIDELLAIMNALNEAKEGRRPSAHFYPDREKTRVM